MKMLKNKKLLAFIGTGLLAVLLIVVITMAIYNDGKAYKLSSGVTFYGFTNEIQLSSYLPLNQSNELLKNNGGIAFKFSEKKVYGNGEYITTDKSVCYKMGGNYLVNCEELNKAVGTDIKEATLSPEEVAKTLGKTLKIYEDDTFVLLDGCEDLSVFDNYYTFEMIALMLRDAPDEDFLNALITLPYEVSNNSNYIIKYTDPDLDLGLQTSLYGEIGSGYRNGERIRIVAGEGAYKNNHTIVRVYNEYSAKTAQFLAYSAKVTGGVKVACAYVPYNDVNRAVIACAAYNGGYKETRAVKVFDEFGILYMSIVPSFNNEAPYNILTGHFAKGVSEEQLLIASSKFDSEGKASYAVYDLSNGHLLFEGKTPAIEQLQGLEYKISLYNEEQDDDILVYIDEENKYRVSFENGLCTYIDLNIETTSLSNGIYQSPFEGSEYISTETVDADNFGHMAFVNIFETGGLGVTKLDVGEFENRLYWNTSNSKSIEKVKITDTKYVKRAKYQHMRCDISNGVIGNLTEENIGEMSEQPYSKWGTPIYFSSYADCYNVWEPCFTHRWIGSKAPILYNYKDANGDQRYATYNREGNPSTYTELSSTFLVGTYAEGLIEMDKMRTYPLRDTLRKLYDKFIDDTEWLAGLEPIHEIEIDSGSGSVGDYNPYNIEGFRSYLISRYDTVEKINKKFGTDFKSREDIMPPTDGAVSGRGDWDKYEGAYFEEWTIFNRSLVNKRLTEAFREAMLAGFPSELISGHSIPEGDAIAGFLGEANTRISPVDAMMTLGTSFGATRYGLWFADDTNFLKLARSAGFQNITLGEYNSIGGDFDLEKEQLWYLFNNGVKYINIIADVDITGAYIDLRAIKEVGESGQPRPSYADGSSYAIPAKKGDAKFLIVELGSADNDTGLIKSVDETGHFTGDIYLVPFHSHIYVNPFTMSTNPRAGAQTATFSQMNTGDVIEMNLLAKYTGEGNAKFVVEVYEDGVLCENLTATYTLTDKMTNYKFVLNNQVPFGRVKIRTHFECSEYSKIEINSFDGSVQRESIARKFYGDYEATEHYGGVTFDIISREFLYGN